jgi:hypothetical protein
MSILRQYFDKIAVISLAARQDRRERLRLHLSSCGLAAEQDITWVEAVDGRAAKLPGWWKSGPGAWGCRASHLQTVAQAQREGAQRLLILEDDVVFHPRAAEWLEKTHPRLPKAWDFFFLGGQHMLKPEPCEHPSLLRGAYITRTHAYAVHQQAYGRFLAEVGDDAAYQEHPGWHIDHQLGAGMAAGRWEAFAPAWWMAGQDEGASNISRNLDQRRWWQPSGAYWQLPFVANTALPEAAEFLCQPQTPPPLEPLPLAVWLRDAAREAWTQGRLPACQLAEETIAKLWPGGLRKPATTAELATLADYPANGLFPHPFAL